MIGRDLVPAASASRNPFSPEEDARLKELVGLFGENKWDSVAREMGGRNVRQCRERWFCFLSNRVRKGEWSTEEDAVLLDKYRQYGSKWKFFESFLPGRKCYAIRNRLHLLVRRMEALGSARLYLAPPVVQPVSVAAAAVPAVAPPSSEDSSECDALCELDAFSWHPDDGDLFLSFV